MKSAYIRQHSPSSSGSHNSVLVTETSGSGTGTRRSIKGLPRNVNFNNSKRWCIVKVIYNKPQRLKSHKNNDADDNNDDDDDYDVNGDDDNESEDRMLSSTISKFKKSINL